MPFREAPTYSNRRRRPPSTLAAPRILLRSNSDNNLNINNIPEWSASSSASSHRSLSPHLLQQMQNNPNGTVKTVGSYTPSSRSRSPSLNRLGEDGKRQQHRHIRWILNIHKVWDIPNGIIAATVLCSFVEFIWPFCILYNVWVTKSQHSGTCSNVKVLILPTPGSQC